jgi:hypothetical protein
MTWDNLVQSLLVRVPFLPSMMNSLVRFTSKEASPVFTFFFRAHDVCFRTCFRGKQKSK